MLIVTKSSQPLHFRDTNDTLVVGRQVQRAQGERHDGMAIMDTVLMTRGVVVPHLAAWRIHRVLTQLELAQQSRVSRPTIARAERGERIDLPTVRKLAAALQIAPQTLLERAPQ